MKLRIPFFLLIAGFLTATAQERLPREEALKYAFAVSLNLKEMLNTPIPTDPDVKRPVAMKQENHGGMILPETKLSPQTFANAGEESKPVGQMWLVNLVPVSAGQPVPVSQQRMVHVSALGQDVDAACCALAVAKKDGGGLELLVYGKDKTPLLHVPLKAISLAQENPIEASGEVNAEGAEVTLRFVGKYEATFVVTEPR